MRHKTILISGKEDSLLDRLPTELSDGTQLSWKVIDLIESIPIDPPNKWENKLINSDWLVLTSATSIHRLVECLGEDYLETIKPLKVACIGKRTQSIATQSGLSVDFYPKTPGSETFLEEFKSTFGDNLKDKTFFFPGALQGRRLIQESLLKWGAQLSEIPLYETKLKEDWASHLTVEQVKLADAVFLTSPSSVDSFLKSFSLKNKRIGCMGNYTKEYLSSLGLKATVLPQGEWKNISKILEQTLGDKP